MTPHFLLSVFTPGETAECIVEGINPGLYEKLWCVHPKCADIPREQIEACALTNWWDLFDETEQKELNEATARFEERCRRQM